MTPNFSFLIDLRWCLDALLEEGIIDQKTYNLITTSRRDQKAHPLQVIAGFKLSNLVDKKPLNIEALNQWLSAKSGVPYLRIDPLKVDVPAVTSIMSYEYARNQYILPVAVTEVEVVIGTDQPFYSDWQDNISQIIKPKVFKTVFLNPEQINRYRTEFYQVTRAIAGANNAQKRAAADVTNVEALLQLGDTQNPDANDQHIVKVVDWLLQYAFEQRARLSL